jgi:hypothetical protein
MSYVYVSYQAGRHCTNQFAFSTVNAKYRTGSKEVAISRDERFEKRGYVVFLFLVVAAVVAMARR